MARTLFINIKRTWSSGYGESAMVRHRQKNAVSTSNVEYLPKWWGIFLLIADTWVDPKKKEQQASSWRELMIKLWGLTNSSNSWCVHVTCGGFLVLRSSLCHTGGIEGAHTRGISLMAFVNWTMLGASLIRWLTRRAMINPPHLSRVTWGLTQLKLIKKACVFLQLLGTFLVANDNIFFR